MTRDEEYIKKRNQERMRQNIIKWWNVKNEGTKSYIGSLELEDPLYGCHVYVPYNDTIADEMLEMDHLSDIDYRDPISDSMDEEIAAIPTEKDDEAVRIANEIYERLQREAAADARKKEDEIAAAKKSWENDNAFNASTGSYSGLYGQTPMNDAEKDAYAAIMAQNNNIAESASAMFQNQE